MIKNNKSRRLRTVNRAEVMNNRTKKEKDKKRDLIRNGIRKNKKSLKYKMRTNRKSNRLRKYKRTHE
mgnify:CR=1 FL=1